MALLCKCMNQNCKNVHWSDLSDEAKYALLHPEEHMREDKEDKSWPPSNMETK